MIVWLASYPRSGNTLLRTVLSECFGLRSTADEPEPIEAAHATGMIGGLASPEEINRLRRVCDERLALIEGRAGNAA